MENENVAATNDVAANENQQVTPDVTVTNNGNTMTASVEPVDPMADPKETDDNTEPPKDDVKDDNNLQADIANQQKADNDAKATLESKGVDFDKLAEEYSNDGKLSDDSMKILKDAGFPESVVNAYLSGLEAINERFATQVKGFAGGDEGYAKLTEFIKTQPQSVIDAFNSTIATGNLGQIELTISGLMSKMNKTYGTANPTIMGGAANATAEGYTSMEQMTKDMSDPRYQVDPKFTRSVMMKIKNATIF